MISQCIICGKPVIVIGTPEIIACDDNYCIRIIEDNIGLHYTQGNTVGIDTAKVGKDIQCEVIYQGNKVIKVAHRGLK